MLDIWIFKTELRLSLLFPATLVLLLAVDQTGLSAFGFAAALLHECGHLTVLLLLGGRPSCLHFSFFGMNMRISEDTPLSNGRQAAVAAAGPLANAACALLLWGSGAPSACVLMHAALFAFNMLPVLPLDGGRILQAALSARLPADQTAKVMTAVSVVVFCPLFALGALLLLVSGYNFTLLAAALYVGLMILFRKGN